ncbi:MAG TPA: DUF5666 domain-containing protein [Thermoanaerobaculia bacterium]|nr:DUF5666 domain-containing protein [Thermoanaerobaculia bacterium]
MARKTLLVLLLLSTTLFASAASAQFTISRSSRWITGTISGVNGSHVLLFDNRLSINMEEAEIRSEYGPATIGSLTPGTRIRAGVQLNPYLGLVGVEVDILPDHEASIRGQIESIDFAGGTLSILGHTVRLTGNTKVYRTSDGALVPLGDLRPLMIVLLELDRDETGLAAKTVAFAPGQANLTTTAGGRLHGIDGDLWSIGSVTVRVTGDTFIGGDPRVGERVQVTYRGSATGDFEAVSILRISSISEEDVAGEVKVLSGQTITIDTGKGATTLRLDEATKFRGEPQVGDVVVARADGNTARSIELVFATDFTFTFSGDVTSVRGNEWSVQGVDFSVTSTTRVTGSPQAGDRVNVTAFQVNDRWYAMTLDKL